LCSYGAAATVIPYRTAGKSGSTIRHDSVP
jgi:hypothetical protein